MAGMSLPDLRKIAVKHILQKRNHEYLLRQALCKPWEASTALDEMAWTDFKKLYFNFPKLEAALNEYERLCSPGIVPQASPTGVLLDPGDRTMAYIGALCHEILHVLWMHQLRGKDRDSAHAWKIACEYSINYYLANLLGKDWITHLQVMYPDDNVLNTLSLMNLPPTTDGFYRLLTEGPGNASVTIALGKPCVCTFCDRPPEDDELRLPPDAMKILLQLPETEEKTEILGFIANIVTPAQQLPWEMLLMGGLEDAVSMEQSWSVPSRRNEMLPGWRHEKLLSFVWILDVSPSINDDMKSSFMNTVQAGILLYHDAQHRIIFFGDGIVGDITVSSGTDLSQIEIPWSNGTCLQEVWEVLEQDLPEYALVLTDLELSPVPKPSFTKIVWGVVGDRRHFHPDYGTIIDLK